MSKFIQSYITGQESRHQSHVVLKETILLPGNIKSYWLQEDDLVTVKDNKIVDTVGAPTHMVTHCRIDGTQAAVTVIDLKTLNLSIIKL